MPGCVIYVVRSWPRLSQTFILNEVLALERRGTKLAIFSMVSSGETVVHPRVTEVRAPVTVLAASRSSPLSRLRAHLAVLAAAPVRYAATLWLALRRPRLAAGYGSCNAVQCFGHAVSVAAGIARIRAAGQQPSHLHAHFAHDPALVGLLAARLTGLPYSFTGHARDLLQIPPAALGARAAAATAVVTCCRANADYIHATVPAAARPPVRVVHHGVDLSRFRPAPAGEPQGLPTIVSVGRLVEKKGYDDLLRALTGLKSAGTAFRAHVYGDGQLRSRLLDLRDELGLANHVELLGARDQDGIVAAMASAHLFALTPRTAGDGDRDGIPNVLVEAMACGLPVVTTTTGGIPELVHHEENGLTTAPEDVPALTAALRRLLADESLRRRFGAAGRETVEKEYDVTVAARALETIFCATSASTRPQGAGDAVEVAP